MISKIFLSRVSIEFINQISILISLPFILFTLGLQEFGIYSKIMIIFQFAFIFTELGFNLYSIASYEESRKDFIFEVANIYFIKLILLILFLSLITFFYLNKNFELDLLNFIGLVSLVIGASFNPLWYFQAIKKIDNFLPIVLIARVIFLVLIFISAELTNKIFFFIISNSIFYNLLSLYGFIKIIPLIKNKSLKYKKIPLILLGSCKYFFYNVLVSRIFSIWIFISLEYMTITNIGIINIIDHFFRAINNLNYLLSDLIFTFFKRLKRKFNDMKTKIFICISFGLVLLPLIVLILSFNVKDDGFYYIKIILFIIFSCVHLTLINITGITLNLFKDWKKISSRLLAFFLLMNFCTLSIYFFISNVNFENLIYYFFIQNFIFFIFLWFNFYSKLIKNSY